MRQRRPDSGAFLDEATRLRILIVALQPRIGQHTSTPPQRVSSRNVRHGRAPRGVNWHRLPNCLKSGPFTVRSVAASSSHNVAEGCDTLSSVGSIPRRRPWDTFRAYRETVRMHQQRKPPFATTRTRRRPVAATKRHPRGSDYEYERAAPRQIGLGTWQAC